MPRKTEQTSGGNVFTQAIVTQRDFNVNGETLVNVKFGAHLPSSISNISGNATNLSQLGLAEGPIRIIPRLFHSDIGAADFGPEVPAEVLGMLAYVDIRMTLIHYDISILDTCLGESVGYSFPTSTPGIFEFAGRMPGAGTPLGNGLPLLASGCHYMSLNLLSPQLNFPWRFRACYLTGPYPEIPLGTTVSPVDVNWRCIPYTIPLSASGNLLASGSFGEIISSGVVLFDHDLDT